MNNMNKIKLYLSKHTKQIRYSFIIRLTKYITPKLNKKIELLNKLGYLVNKPINHYIPRPTIQVIKKYFGNKYIIGAEIGVNKGYNAEYILRELRIKKLYLIDTWKNYKGIDVLRNDFYSMYDNILKKFKNKDNVEIIRGYSSSIVNNFNDNSLDFVYIDGNHEYKYVYNDINIWYNKVKNKGIIGGHDVFNIPSVLKAIINWCINNKKEFYIDIPDWYIIK